MSHVGLAIANYDLSNHLSEDDQRDQFEVGISDFRNIIYVFFSARHPVRRPTFNHDITDNRDNFEIYLRKTALIICSAPAADRYQLSGHSRSTGGFDEPKVYAVERVKAESIKFLFTWSILMVIAEVVVKRGFYLTPTSEEQGNDGISMLVLRIK